MPITSWRLALWAEPARGDIVVFFEPLHEQRYVKRVVGLPGDLVELRRNRLLINGREAAYQPLGDQPDGAVLVGEDLGGRMHPLALTPGARSRSFFGPVHGARGPVLPDGR